MKIKSRALATAIAAAALTAVPVGAQQGAPAPGCAGVNLTDPAGDASRTAGEAPPSTDILAIFYTYDDGKLYANMQLADAQDELAPGATGMRWYIMFKSGTETNWVRATKTGPVDATFNYGHVDPADDSRVSDGTTEGKFFPGPNGVIQILVPADVGGTSGKTLTGTMGETDEAIVNQLFPIDETKAGKPYTVGSCGATPPPGSTPPPAGTPTPPPSTKPDVVALQVSPPKSAKAKGKAVSLTLKSKDEIKDIKAALKKGSKTIGRGALARLKGKGTLKVKFAKKPKKGSYTLELTGTNADGSPGSLTTKLKLK